MNKQQLAAKIWESANQMRSKIEANEYKDYILGFIFYKYLSEKELKFVKGQGITEEDFQKLTEADTDAVNHIKSNIGYFIAHKDLFSTWIKVGADFSVSDVRDALSAFSRLISPAHKKLFDGIFETLQTGLSKLGESAAVQTKAINELIQLIKEIPMDGKQDYDVLGFIYEYLISNFAATAGKKAGEFYTPHEVSLLMSEIVAHHLKDRKQIQIYDPTSGSGSLLINIGKSIERYMDTKNNIKYYAQELKQNTYNLTRMNLVMRGILATNIVTRNGDTLEEDWPYFDENDSLNSYNPLYVDAVVSNPPYSQKWDPTDKETDARYARFGMAPKSKADFAFLLHDLYHLRPDGIMAIVLPHGVLFRGGEEGAIRRNLIEDNHIDAVIGLPSNIFFGTGIPTVILILKQKREASDILVIDASKGFVKEGKNNKLKASDIKRIVDTVIARQSVPNYAKSVTREEIRSNDYNLNIPRYVDSSEKAESWDIYATMFGGIPIHEIDDLNAYWQAFPALQSELFAHTSEQMAVLRVEDIKTTIAENKDVKNFVQRFKNVFADFDSTLKQRLIEGMFDVNLSKEVAMLSEDIFNRLTGIPLVDKYQAFQLLDNQWQGIVGDLEMLQTEGFEITRKVLPNLVIKKRNKKDVEVQEGWLGYLFPFELVQKLYLTEELQSVSSKQNRLTEITAEVDELLEALSEETKESSIVNEAQDAFVNAELIKMAKEINLDIKKGSKYTEEEDETKILQANAFLAEEKTLKKAIKEEEDALHLLTKKTIESLSDAQVKELLDYKWVKPLVEALNDLPVNIIQALSQKVSFLSEKYATTLQEVSTDLQNTERELAKMMEELRGDEHDILGLSELQKLLKGNEHGN